ncbi:hypothetical protein H5410_025725 [Solanum commersonii]|uniref:Uncharacterized protein n=1 Tax=Solanum commersonii TaxID=4109 RepID=A0A9J5YUK4_SOLCO|nr:hypothetical protein H5410_025725 [Solanum commersonii]
MERVVNPGPIDRTLLLSQHEHKSELLWKCEISFGSLMRTVLFGLRIDSDVVYMQDAIRRIHPWRILLETLTKCTITPVDIDGASRVRIHNIIGYLRDQLQVDPIRDATPVERVEKISRLYKLVILGASYFRTRLVLERILLVQSSTPPPHDGDILLSYARRWTCGIDKDTESHHVLISIRVQLDRMTKDYVHQIIFATLY